VIVGLPFHLSPGVIIETRTQNVDLWPTLLDLLGLPPLPDTDGRSMLAAIEAAAQESDSDEQDELAFAQLQAAWARDPEESYPLVAMNSDRWRLLYDGRRPERPQLFDKQTDPEEKHDLADREPEVVEELTTLLEAYLARTDSPWGEAAPVIEIDDMQLQQLRAIGYGVP
jgi:arylsulfatase A-like enzyme